MKDVDSVVGLRVNDGRDTVIDDAETVFEVVIVAADEGKLAADDVTICTTLDTARVGLTATDDVGRLAPDEVVTPATLEIVDGVVAIAEDEELTTAEFPSDPTQAKLILLVSVPEDFGALKSQFVAT
jgi:hypothetical protein